MGGGIQWHQLDHMQTMCTSLQTDNHTDTSSLNFYRPDALPDSQPTVSKHWRQANENDLMDWFQVCAFYGVNFTKKTDWNLQT